VRQGIAAMGSRAGGSSIAIARPIGIVEVKRGTIGVGPRRFVPLSLPAGLGLKVAVIVPIETIPGRLGNGDSDVATISADLTAKAPWVSGLTHPARTAQRLRVGLPFGESQFHVCEREGTFAASDAQGGHLVVECRISHEAFHYVGPRMKHHAPVGGGIRGLTGQFALPLARRSIVHPLVVASDRLQLCTFQEVFFFAFFAALFL